jgi:hypothetical protein
VNARFLALAASFALVLTLAACGKAGSPVVPGSNFPRNYPDPRLSPTQTKFTDKGSYIDPAVKDTELRGNTNITAGSTLPLTTTTSPGSNTPFNNQAGITGASPLMPNVGTTPQDEQTPQ